MRIDLREIALTLALAMLGCVSAWLYWRWLVQPYFLPRYVEQWLLDLGKIGGYGPAAGRRYTFPLIAIWAAYLAACAVAARVKGEWSLRALAWAGGAGCAILLLWLYPITAADIFNYWIYGLVQHRGQNPLVVEPRDVIPHPLIGYSAWPFYPSPYGPVWQGISWAITAVTGENLLASVLGFKIVLVACHLLNTLLIDRIAGASGLARPGVAALAYAWNPLLLYETAGNGHNDIVMLTGLLVALWLVVRGRPAAAFPAVTLAALAKFVAGLWLPALLLGWLPARFPRRDWWREARWRALLLAGVVCALLVVLSYAPFWVGEQTFAGVRRQSDLATTSLASWLIALVARTRPTASGWVLDTCKGIALVAIVLVVLLKRPRADDPRGLVHALFDVSLVYLLLGALWFQPWYLVPLVGLSPLAGAGRRLIAIVYALGATGSYVFYFYGWPALSWTSDRLLVQSWAVGIAHGPVWVVLVGLGVGAVVRKRMLPRAQQG